MTEQEFLAYKIPLLIKEGRSREQATAISYTMYKSGKHMQKAQQGMQTFDPNKPTQRDLGIYNAQQAMPQQGIMLDPNNMSQETYQPDAELLNRARYNKFINSQQDYSGSDNYDENGNAKDTSNSYQDYTRLHIANPYTGVDPMARLYWSGQQFGKGNTAGGILGAVGGGLGIARTFMSGLGAGKENQRQEEDMRYQLYGKQPNYEYGQVGNNATYNYSGGMRKSQEGGKITNADMMSGNYTTDMQNPNIEVEDGEHLKNSQTGMITEAKGKTHEQGGIPVNLPNESKVLSDFTKIGAENAKKFQKQFDIAFKASHTFADVMDKVNNKIGLTKLIEEEKEYTTKIEKQLKSSIDEATKKVNLNFLSKEMEKLQKQKEMLQPIQDKIFEEVFKAQEKIPKKLDGYTLLKQEGGDVQAQQSPEQIVADALSQGANPQEIVQYLVQNGFIQDQAEQLVQQVQGQEMPMAQEGKFVKPSYEDYGVDTPSIDEPITQEYINAMKAVTEDNSSDEMTSEQAKSFMDNYNRDQNSSTKGFDANSARDTWEKKTGLPWSEARRLGYTDGTAKDNIKLLGELNDSRFKKENLRKNPIGSNKPQNPTANNRQTPPPNTKQQSYEEATKNLPKYKGNQGKIQQADDGNMINRIGERLANPIQTFGHLAKYGELPAEGFSKNDKNAYDQVLGWANPFYWANALGNSVDYAGEGEYGKAGREALDALPALSKLKYVKNVPIPKGLSQASEKTLVKALLKVKEATGLAKAVKSGVGASRRVPLNIYQDPLMLTPNYTQLGQGAMRLGYQEGGQTQQPPPEQIIQMFSQMTGQDPQEIIAQLQQMQPEEQQQAIQQMVVTLQQGQQNPQEEQMSNPQEENQEIPMAQEGKLTQAQKDGRFEDFYKMASNLGYTGKKQIGEMQTWMAKNYPDDVAKYFNENGQPLTAKHVDIIKSKYKDTFQKAGISSNKPSAQYTQEEKAKLKEALGEKADKNFLLEGFQDNKWDWRYPQVSVQRDNPSTADNSIKAPLMQKTVTGETITPEEQAQLAEQQTIRPRGIDKTVMAQIPSNFILPPDSLRGVYKPSIDLSRLDPIKISPESNLAAIEGQRQATADSLDFLPENQRAALLANMLGTTQASSNQTIGSTTQANTAQQYQTDVYNASQGDKEQLTNVNLAKDYESKMYAAIRNTDIDNRSYIDQLNRENRQKFLDVSTLNMLNQVTPNYQSDGANIYFNNASANMSNPQDDPYLMQIYKETEGNPVARAKKMKELYTSRQLESGMTFR